MQFNNRSNSAVSLLARLLLWVEVLLLENGRLQLKPFTCSWTCPCRCPNLFLSRSGDETVLLWTLGFRGSPCNWTLPPEGTGSPRVRLCCLGLSWLLDFVCVQFSSVTSGLFWLSTTFRKFCHYTHHRSIFSVYAPLLYCVLPKYQREWNSRLILQL